MQFFLSLGHRGKAAVILAGLLLSLAAGQVRSLAINRGTVSYHDFLTMLLGNWQLPADIAIASFLFGGLVIMLAGSGAVFRQYFGLCSLSGILACSGVALLASTGRGRSLLVLNTLLVPVMLAIMLLAVASQLKYQPRGIASIPVAGGLVSANWVLNAFLYATYNMIGGMVLLTSLPETRRGIWGARLAGLLLGVAAYFLVMALACLSPPELRLELPMLQVVTNSQPQLLSLYALALWLAMVTTAASQLYGLVARVAQSFSICSEAAAIGILLLALPAATLGFASLVSWIYPLYGYLGLLLIIQAIIRYLTKRYF
ncbi:MAG: hypothetical protein GX039_07270 [Clostridia bacterium]|nr:hypothetical protein [Clostridia bacterium]